MFLLENITGREAVSIIADNDAVLPHNAYKVQGVMIELSVILFVCLQFERIVAKLCEIGYRLNLF